VYELRTYSLVPSQVGNFLALTKDKFHLRTQHSKLLGYWTAELGGLNQLVHIWKYDNYKHRAAVRAKLGGDAEWQQEYFQKILPWLQHQDNMTLTSLVDPVENEFPGGTYELWQFKMNSPPGAWHQDLVGVASGLQGGDTSLCGVWSGLFGHMNTGVVLWRHGDLDNAGDFRKRLQDSQEGQIFWKSVGDSMSKALLPTVVSPWK